MRKLSRITKFAALVVAGTGLLALSAQASLTFNLDQTASGGPGPAGTIFGTVNLAQGGDANTVIVRVDLNSPSKFVGTGAGFSLGFDLIGHPAITISGLSSPFVAGSGGSASWTGSWQYDVDTTTHGASTSLPGPLVFSVSSAGGLSPASFVANARGYFFEADIIGPNGKTGNVAAFGPVPEPTTFIAGALLLLPFGASTLRMLRKKQVA